MRTERNDKATLFSQKVPVFYHTTKDASSIEYLKFLMPYAFKYVHQHLDASSKVQMEATTEAESFVCTYHGHTITATPNSCSCYFRQSLRLPCKHMFAIRVQLGFPIFHESLCDKRRTSLYYKESQRVFQDDNGAAEIESISQSVDVHRAEPKKKRVLSQVSCDVYIEVLIKLKLYMYRWKSFVRFPKLLQN